jgi:hypothetical protein
VSKLDGVYKPNFCRDTQGRLSLRWQQGTPAGWRWVGAYFLVWRFCAFLSKGVQNHHTKKLKKDHVKGALQKS